ncbi:hypothetical protein M758_8G024700 [Ceratodon purpureus]|uniref:Uncharacterized protein n=1 Tax=Ceratodon purpureus TaxID=3225 RepID=A0A8T0GWJ2_CERPU|nr:hypothetical protein KC19_8G027800 [Ceratodon purpureus]KAG0607393.1 hypothetical protein M758_8G024700 [Ceratodon purpureus]
MITRHHVFCREPHDSFPRICYIRGNSMFLWNTPTLLISSMCNVSQIFTQNLHRRNWFVASMCKFSFMSGKKMQSEEHYPRANSDLHRYQHSVHSFPRSRSSRNCTQKLFLKFILNALEVKTSGGSFV